jgi:hypothetical protein
MIWIAIVAFCVTGAAMIVNREPFARMQAMLLGGRIVPGCVIAEAAMFLILAAIVFIFRALLR